MYDVIIVGGGASGLMAAVNSTGNIAIVEKMIFSVKKYWLPETGDATFRI